MIISKNSQLGLRFEDSQVKLDFLMLCSDNLKNGVKLLDKIIDAKKEGKQDLDITQDELERLGLQKDEFKITMDTAIFKQEEIMKKVGDIVKSSYVDENQPDYILYESKENSKYFLICDSVYEASALIRIGEGFTARTLKDISLGQYTYLLGKHKMLRFVVVVGAIKGFYYDDKDNVSFEFGLDIETGDYFAPPNYSKIFSKIMQIMTFVELGDIEVLELMAGRNNGKDKNNGKITNTHNYTVFVVDSSWNKIIVRTDGFAVRGHFRLQPCGINMGDRKLVWINAFEKHGYTRRPKAEIVR
jgi:hypothetical protein